MAKQKNAVAEQKMPNGIPVSQFLKEYSSDATAFLAKYKGQGVEINGTVSSIIKGTGNVSMIVVFKDPQYPLAAVKAEFPNGIVNSHDDLVVSSDGLSATIIDRMPGTVCKKRTGRIVDETPLLTAGQSVVIKGLFSEIQIGVLIITACQFQGEQLAALQRKR